MSARVLTIASMLLLLSLLEVRVPTGVATAPSSCAGGVVRYAAVLQYLRSAYMAWDGNMPSVVQFTDTPTDDLSRLITLATVKDTGNLMGLAYDPEDDVLYAGAYVKAFGVETNHGARQIYRIAVSQGGAHPWIELPGKEDTPFPVPGNLVGKQGLGDLEIDPIGRTLLAVDLENRRIYRLSLSDGHIVGSFDHGGAGEPWSVNARPFALAFRDGWLFHGVVDSRQDGRVPGSLSGYIYRSRPDGSDLRLVASFPLYRTARSESWRPWDDRSNPDETMLGQPMISDIEFDKQGRLIIGIRDRASDMRLDTYMQRSPQGDVLATRRVGDTWQILTSGDDVYDDRTPFYSDASEGTLAAAPYTDAVVVTALGVGRQANPGSDALLSGVIWLDNSTKMQLSLEPLIGCFPCQRPIDALGDIEATCPDTVQETPTASRTVTPSAADTPTATATPLATQTPSPTASATKPVLTMTPTHCQVYLPGLVREACTQDVRWTDLMFVVDASTTMLELTRAGRTKIDAAREAAITLASDLDAQRDRVGLVWFNESAHLGLAPTLDREALRVALAHVEVRELTRIELGLAAAHDALVGALSRVGAASVIVLLTDGRANPGSADLAIREAIAAKADGITVFAVGVGDHIDAAGLQAIASSPAHFLRAPDGEDVPFVYARIRDILPCPDEVFWPNGGGHAVIHQDVIRHDGLGHNLGSAGINRRDVAEEEAAR